MKAKKMELREEGKNSEGNPRYDLYINGEISSGGYFEFNKRSNIIINRGEFRLKECIEILSCSFSDLPDGVKIDGIFAYESITENISMASIKRQGEELILGYYLGGGGQIINSLWNEETFNNEILKQLQIKGFSFDKGLAEMDVDDDSMCCLFYHHYNNPKETLKEIADEGLRIIKETEDGMHLHLLKLASKELKSITKS